MKNFPFKFKNYLLPLLASSALLSASQESCRELTQESATCFSKTLVELKTGYFHFSNSQMRKVYDKGGWDIQLCASYSLWKLSNRWALDAYGSIGYLQRSGQSINGQQPTSLWSVPLNIGLKPIYTVSSNLKTYLAMGPRYFYVHQHNHSSYVYKSKSRNGLGLFANAGFYYALSDRVVIDIFAEYSYAKVHFHNREDCVYTTPIQMGGFVLGVGLGYKF